MLALLALPVSFHLNLPRQRSAEVACSATTLTALHLNQPCRPRPRQRTAEVACSATTLTALDATIEPRSCMGTWYVQRQIPALALLEGGARNGVERYEWDDATSSFSVCYTFNRRGKADEDVTTVRQRGWVASEQGTQWQVAPLLGGFCPPVRLPFVILDVDPAAGMVCSGGLDSWMYVLTREKRPDGALVDALLATAAAAGIDMAKVSTVEHT